MNNSPIVFYSAIYLTIGLVWIFISDLLITNLQIPQDYLVLFSLASDVVFLAFSFLFLLVVFRKLSLRNKDAEHKTLQLTEKNQNLERIAHVQTHNARSPIATIMGLTHIYETSDGSDFNNDLIEKIQGVCEQADEKIKTSMLQAAAEDPEGKPATHPSRNIFLKKSKHSL